MKLPEKETPEEKVTFTNVFGDEYTPDEYEFICDDCLENRVEDLEEDVFGLSADIMSHEDKINQLEDNQVMDIENLTNVIDILECMQKTNHMMLDVIIEQDKRYDSIHVWFFIRQFILTILVILIGIHVFF